MCAVAYIYYIKLCFVSGLLFIRSVQRLDKEIHRFVLHDADGTSAETASGNPGAKHAGNLPGQLCQQICLCAGYFKVVPE